MTAIRASSPVGRVRAPSTVLLGLVAALVLIDLAAAIAAGGLVDQALVLVTHWIAQIAFVLAGARLLRDRPHAGLGRLMLAIAGVGALNGLSVSLHPVGLTEFAASFIDSLEVALIVHLLVRWPDRRVNGSLPRALVVAAYVVPLVLTAVWELTWSPRWFDGDERSRAWITLVPARDLSAAVWQVQQVVLVALVVALLALVVAKALAGRGRRRAALVPVAIVAAVLAATDVVRIAVSLGAPIDIDPSAVQNLALLAVPIAVLVAVVRSPSVVDAPGQPGRRVHLDDAARERYHLGLAGVAAAIVVVIAVVFATSSGQWPDAPSAPQPSPALQGP